MYNDFPPLISGYPWRQRILVTNKDGTIPNFSTLTLAIMMIRLYPDGPSIIYPATNITLISDNTTLSGIMKDGTTSNALILHLASVDMPLLGQYAKVREVVDYEIALTDTSVTDTYVLLRGTIPILKGLSS